MDERQQVILHKLQQKLPKSLYGKIKDHIAVADKQDWDWLEKISQNILEPNEQKALYDHCAQQIKTAHNNIKKAGYQLQRLKNAST